MVGSPIMIVVEGNETQPVALSEDGAGLRR